MSMAPGRHLPERARQVCEVPGEAERPAGVRQLINRQNCSFLLLLFGAMGKIDRNVYADGSRRLSGWLSG